MDNRRSSYSHDGFRELMDAKVERRALRSLLLHLSWGRSGPLRQPLLTIMMVSASAAALWKPQTELDQIWQSGRRAECTSLKAKRDFPLLASAGLRCSLPLFCIAGGKHG